jgi:hypothetical protein
MKFQAVKIILTTALIGEKGIILNRYEAEFKPALFPAFSSFQFSGLFVYLKGGKA